MNRYLKEIRYQFRYCLPVWFIQSLTAFLPDIGPFIKMRGCLVAFFLPNRPRGFMLGRDVTLLNINRLYIGDCVYIAKGAWLNAIGNIYLDSEVTLSPYVVISSTLHGFKDGSVYRGGSHPAEVSVGFGSWVSSHSVVNAGVAIGKGVVIAANSVVTKSTDDNVILGGVPAKYIKPRIDNPSNLKTKHDIS
ncbi:hypothetical protein ACFD7N_004242 [Vibrio vulnificus]